jgi:predicted  nucleic acid-binding Zn-ribbon protein|uniref:DUF465 domain-containing protein n=1 Tax=Leptospirillum ferrodiazotrophum TaxID=412449 RepID=C6HXA0_9BACT|nr:MAG: protein of unknown function [Leptospirillum ferrodiazotrophum]
MDEIAKKRHEIEAMKSRHDALDTRLAELSRRGILTEEENREMTRIKWEKRDLKEKIVQGESRLEHSSGSA